VCCSFETSLTEKPKNLKAASFGLLGLLLIGYNLVRALVNYESSFRHAFWGGKLDNTGTDKNLEGQMDQDQFWHSISPDREQALGESMEKILWKVVRIIPFNFLF
jgi:hypothetical protein